mgnify:CR=1 FL=1
MVKSRIKWYTLLVVCALMTAAWSSSHSTTIRVIWQPSAGASSYFYADQEKLFEKYGLKIDAIKIDTGPAELPILASDSADIAYMGGPPAVAGMAQGIPIKFFYVGYDAADSEGLYMNPALGVKNLRDVVGKTIAVTRGNTAHVALRQALKKEGLPLDSVKLKFMGSAQMLPAYYRGDIDGAWLTSTWGGRLIELGAKLVFNEVQLGISMPSGWVVTEKFLKKNPEAVAKFVAALDEGAKAINSDPTTVSKHLADLTGNTVAQAEKMLADVHYTTTLDMLADKSGISFVAAGGIAQSLANLSTELFELALIPRALSVGEVEKQVEVETLRKAQKLPQSR